MIFDGGLTTQESQAMAKRPKPSAKQLGKPRNLLAEMDKRLTAKFIDSGLTVADQRGRRQF